MRQLKGFINRHNYKRVIAACGVAVFAIVLTIIAVVSSIKSDKYTSYDLNDPVEREENDKRTQTARYVSETVYDGAKVPYILYDMQFISDEEKDIEGNLCYTNKELVDIIGEEKAEEYAEIARSFYDLELGNSADKIAADTDAFISSYCEARKGSTSVSNGLHGEDAVLEDSMDVNELASEIAQMYVDNGLTLKTEVLTDKSLVYMKQYYYFVRGEILITPMSDGHKAGEQCQPLYDQFGITANYGEETEVFFEMQIEPNKDRGVAVSNLYQPR